MDLAAPLTSANLMHLDLNSVVVESKRVDRLLYLEVCQLKIASAWDLDSSQNSRVSGWKPRIVDLQARVSLSCASRGSTGKL